MKSTASRPNEPSIAVIIPAFNEAEAIGQVIGDIPSGLVREVVVVNNASTDATERNARRAGATVLAEGKRGYGHACLRGIRYLEHDPPGVVVFLDGDYSDHPDEMDELVRPILDGSSDFVVGSRMRGARERGAMLPQAVAGNLLACTLMRWFWDSPFTDLGPFRAIRYDCLLALGMEETTFGWTIEMQIKALQNGLRCMEIPVSYRRRVGVSKITGTINGTLRASARILWMIARHSIRPGSRQSIRHSSRRGDRA